MRHDIFELNSVFDHDADPDTVNALRTAVVDDLFYLRGKYADIGKVTAAELDSGDYVQMREKYSRLLHYGSFSLPRKRAAVNELVWKWTEATGKYVGCQFWSLRAKSLFDDEVHCSGGWPITAKVARAFEIKLSKRSRPMAIRLTHEHVYPIKDMKRWLSSSSNLTRKEIQNHLERQCVSCVLLEAEHDRSVGDDANPWLRYKRASIYLAPNPGWLDSQQKLIIEAGLLRVLPAALDQPRRSLAT